MNQQEFEEYTHFAYNTTSGTASSYISAIKILDRLFATKDVFGLHGMSLTELDDAILLQRIVDFVVLEERKYKNNEESFFQYSLPNQTSYPKKGFCSAAIKHLQRYQTYEPQEIEANAIADRLSDGKPLNVANLMEYGIRQRGMSVRPTSLQHTHGQMVWNLQSGLILMEILQNWFLIPLHQRYSLTMQNIPFGLSLEITLRMPALQAYSRTTTTISVSGSTFLPASLTMAMT